MRHACHTSDDHTVHTRQVHLVAEGVAQNGPEVGASICHGTTVAEPPRMARLCGTTPSRRDSSAAAVPRLRRWPLCRYLRDTLRAKQHSRIVGAIVNLRGLVFMSITSAPRRSRRAFPRH